MSSGSTAGRNSGRFLPFLLLLLSFACGGQAENSYEIILTLVTADGLAAEDPVIHDQKKVGTVLRVRPAMNQAEAVIHFENGFRPSTGARFVLERTEDGGRLVRIIDAGSSASAMKLPSGRKVPTRVPVETVEDRLWVEK